MMNEKKELQDSVEDLKKKLNKIKITLKETKVENKVLTGELNRRPSNSNMLNAKKLKNEVVKSNRDVAVIRTKNRELEDTIAKLNTDLSRLKRKAIEDQGKIKTDLEMEIQKLKDLVKSKDSQLDTIEKMKKAESAKRQRERAEREKKQKERQKKQATHKVQEIKIQREEPPEVKIEAPKEGAGLEDLKKDLERALEQLKHKNAYIKGVKEDYAELADKFSKCEQEVDTKMNEIADMDDQLRDSADALGGLSQELAAAQSKINQSGEEIDRLKRGIEDLNRKAESQKQAIVEEENKVTTQKAELGKLEMEMANLKDNLTKLKDRAEAAEAEGKEQETNISKQVVLQKKVENLKQSVLQLEESKVKMGKEIDDKGLELSELKTQIGHLQSELGQLQNSLKEARQEAKDVKDQLESAQTRASGAEAECKEAVQLREQDKKELKTLQDRHQDYNKYREKASSYDKLKDEVIYLRDMKNEFILFKRTAGNVVKVTKENVKLNDDIILLDKEIEALKYQKGEDDKIMADVKQELAGKDEMMNMAVDRKMKHVLAAREENEILRAKLEESQKELGNFVSEIYFVEILLEEKETLLDNITKRMNEMESAGVDLQGYILKNKEMGYEQERLKEEIEDLTEKVREAIRMEMDLKEEQRQMQEQALRREEDIAKLKEPLKLIALLETKVRSQYEQIINMVVEINAKKKRLTEKDLEQSERDKRLAELTELERMLRKRNEMLEKSLSEERRQRDEVLRREREKMLLEVENRGLTETLGGLEKLHEKVRERDRDIAELKENIRKMNNGVSDFVSSAELARVKGDLMETRRVLGQANDKTERVEEEKERFQEANRILSKRVRELEIKIEEKREEMTGLAMRASELTVRMNESMLREQSLKREVVEIKDILEYKNQLSRLETEKQMKLRERLAEAEAHRRESEEKTRQAERSQRQATERAERIEQENRTLEDNQIHTTANFVDRFNSKQKEVDQQKADANYYKDKLELMRNEREDTKERCRQLENAIQRAGGSTLGGQEAIQHSLIRGGKSRVNQLAVLKDIDDRAKEREKIRKLNSDVARLEKSNREMRKELEGKVYMHADNREGLQKKIDELTEKLDVNKRRLEEMTEKAWESDQLRATVSKMQKVEKDMLRQEAFKKTQMDQMEREVEEVGYLLDQKVTENKKRIHEKEKMLGEKGAQGAEIILLGKKVRKLEQEKSELEEKLRDLIRDKEYLDRTLKQRTKEKETKEFELEKAGTKRGELEETLGKKDVSIKKLEDERERLRGQLDTKRGECVKLMDEKKAIVERAEGEFGKEKALREKETKLRKEFGEENREMKERVQELEKKVSTVEKDFEETNSENQVLMNTLVRTEEDLRNNIVRKQRRIKDLEDSMSKTDNQKVIAKSLIIQDNLLL